MNRRSFFRAALAVGMAAAIDPERLLWEPGKKLISIPKPQPLVGWMGGASVESRYRRGAMSRPIEYGFPFHHFYRIVGKEEQPDGTVIYRLEEEVSKQTVTVLNAFAVPWEKNPEVTRFGTPGALQELHAAMKERR